MEGKPQQGAFIAEETEPLAGLWEVNREVVLKASRGEKPKEATIDQDATVVESHKEESQWTYLGEKGYQPVCRARHRQAANPLLGGAGLNFIR